MGVPLPVAGGWLRCASSGSLGQPQLALLADYVWAGDWQLPLAAFPLMQPQPAQLAQGAGAAGLGLALLAYPLELEAMVHVEMPASVLHCDQEAAGAVRDSCMPNPAMPASA